jgi:glycosyltransferase involved in cell wall biosynthesis
VNIVTERSRWILTRIARALADRLDYIRINAWRGSFDITYFMPYYRYAATTSPVTAALFTHRDVGFAKYEEAWDRCREKVDCCVALSPRYRDMLVAEGARRVVYIEPGLDLEVLTPRLRVGFVGRRYADTGRKGEQLLDRVAALDFVELRATEGKVSWEKIPEFYRGLDVVLITSRHEGLPMCVLEGLACGIPVVSTDVGIVPEFKEGVTVFDGTFAALEKILRDRFAGKLALRRQVEHLTWDAFARHYDELFRELRARRPA